MSRELSVLPNPGSPKLRACSEGGVTTCLPVQSPPQVPRVSIPSSQVACRMKHLRFLSHLCFLLGPFPLQRSWLGEASRRAGSRGGWRPSWELSTSFHPSLHPPQIPGLPPLCPWLPARTAHRADTPGCSCFSSGTPPPAQWRSHHSRS